MSFDKDYLAQLILRDAEQLKQRAGGALGGGASEPGCPGGACDALPRCTRTPSHGMNVSLSTPESSTLANAAAGVGAYLQKPVQRERPNTRFLNSTLKSVQFGAQGLGDGSVGGRV